MKLAAFVTGLMVMGALGCASGPSTAPGGSTADEITTATSEVPIANFRQVSETLYRGGHPDAAGMQYLASIGVRTIVDLEVADFIEATPSVIRSELADAAAAGIDVVRAPMSAFEPALSTRFDRQMDEVLATLADPDRGPIYVHCRHGQDRTGLVIGLERVKNEGWAPADAYAEMLEIGFHPGFLGLNHYFETKTGWDD